MSWRDRATPVTDEPSSSWRDRATPVVEPQQPIDAGSAAILKGAQGVTGGWLDELSGAFEAAGSLVGLEGLGGPTGNIRMETRPRTFAEAYDEGQRRKQEMLARAEVESPILSQLAETGGAIASGLALPASAVTTAGKIGTGMAASGFAGAGYAEGEPVDKIAAGMQAAPIGAIIPAAASGIQKVAQSDAAAKLGREAVKKFGRTATTMPEELIERYIDRGRLMNKDDNLIKIAEEIPDDLRALQKSVSAQSGDSRKILEAEGVKVPRVDVVSRLRELIGMADPNNTSNTPILTKLRQRLDQLTPKSGKIEDISVSGSQQAVAPTSTRTVVGPGTGPDVGRDIYGIPKSEARGITKTLSGIDEVNISGNEQIIAPTSARAVVTTPGYQPPDMIEGGKVKDIVQDIGDLIQTAEPGFKKTSGGKLADKAYGYLQEPIKSASPAYTAKMQEIADQMGVLSRARKRFGEAEKTFGKLRLIGGNQERANWARKDLESLESLLGKNYTERVKDAITLDAFTKPGVQGSRSVNIGRAAGGTAGPVGETVGGMIGGAVDYYGRSLLKKGIDLQQRIQFMPPQYRQVFDRAVQKGGNAAAVTHHTLFSKDPEYRKLMQEMDEAAE